MISRRITKLVLLVVGLTAGWFGGVFLKTLPACSAAMEAHALAENTPG